MSEFLEQALKKLAENDKAGRFNNKAAAMKKEVRKALEEFCRQDEEFAQAVVQGGNFVECMEAVAKGVGSSISDLEAYRRAVRFYFPGAEIRMQMTVDLIGDAGKPDTAPAGSTAPAAGLILDFTQFL